MAVTLTYHDKEMDLEPKNISMLDAACTLLDTRTVVVRLEPGDATRYDLVIVPAIVMKDIGHAYGIQPLGDFLWVSTLNLRPDSSAGAWHYIPYEKPQVWDYTEMFANPWAPRLVSHFMAALSEKIREQR